MNAPSDTVPDSPDSMNVFDRTLVRRHRDRAAPDLADHDFLFMEGAERLCDRLLDINRHFSLGLDLGCHAGELSRALAAIGRIDTLVQADLSLDMARMALARTIRPTVVMDEEQLPFALNIFDIVMSNLSLHWVNDLPGALAQIRMSLKPDGLFLGQLLGGETLFELRSVLGDAEHTLDGGWSPRVSPFADVRDLGALLQRAGFALPVVDTDTITVRYADPFRLLRDLRGMGESNAVLERRRVPLKRQTLMAAMARYVERFADADGRIPATFEILTMTAWAPAPTQQKPLQPGSAGRSLARALGGDEISLGEKADPKGR
ncbi:MAG: methyltransferase domain-containing protein [Rhodospirillales bacterium]